MLVKCYVHRLRELHDIFYLFIYGGSIDASFCLIAIKKRQQEAAILKAVKRALESMSIQLHWPLAYPCNKC